MMGLVDGRFSSGRGIQVTMSRLIAIIMVVMVVGFVLSIMLAIVYSFKETTSTHCGVSNYLPSTSAAISVPPSSYVWRFVIILCAGQRLFLVSFHYTLYASVSPSVAYTLLCRVCFGCELLENLGLIGLTCVSSSENSPVHQNMFTVFQICSMLFMVCMCVVHNIAINSGMSASKSEHGTLKWLMLYCGANICSFFVAIFFYFRHERYCEPGVYTLFAIFEYLVVLSNIAFHYLVTSNFVERELVLGSRVLDKKH